MQEGRDRCAGISARFPDVQAHVFENRSSFLDSVLDSGARTYMIGTPTIIVNWIRARGNQRPART
jgi:hypothetical protein